MTEKDIIKLAMEYGFTGSFDAQGELTYDATFVNAVTEAVAKTRKATLEEMIYAHPTASIKQAVEYEREACAKLCDWMQEKAEFHGTDCCKFPTPTDCAYAIRARGEA